MEEQERQRFENEEKMKLDQEEQKKKKNSEIPDMKDLGNISGIDGGIDIGDNMDGGDFGDDNMGD